MTGELKPCPFCAVEVSEYPNDERHARLIVHPVGNGHCPCAGKVFVRSAWNTRAPVTDNVREALEGISPAVAAVMGVMGGFMSYPASMVATDASEESGVEITEKQALKIMRALHAFGLADFGRLYNEDEPLIAGSGYWLNKQGISFRAALSSMEKDRG